MALQKGVSIIPFHGPLANIVANVGAMSEFEIGYATDTNQVVFRSGGAVVIASGGGSGSGGTVTSVGLTLPADVFSVAGSPVTGAGTFAVTYNSQAAGLFLASPALAAGVPTVRAIVPTDVPTLNQNTTGTAANVTGTVAIANGGTGQAAAAAAFTALAPMTAEGDMAYLDGSLAAVRLPRTASLTVQYLGQYNFPGNPVVPAWGGLDMGAASAGQLSVARGGTGQGTAAGAITALTGTQSPGTYLRSNGTTAALSTIIAGDVPTLNQNTTGTAGGLSATLAVGSGGTGATAVTAAGVVCGNAGGTAYTSSAALTSDGTTLTVTEGLTQSGGAVSINANAASTIKTSAGAMSVDAATGLSLGTTNATSVAVGQLAVTPVTVSGTTWAVNGSSTGSVDAGTALSVGTTNATSVTISRSGQLTKIVGDVATGGTVSGSVVDPAVCDVRLSLTGSTAVPTTDVTGATTLFATCESGDTIAVWVVATSSWAYYHTQNTDLTISLSGKLAHSLHDVAVDSTGALSLTAWNYSTGAITGVTTGGAAPSYTAVGHGLSVGDLVIVEGCTGTSLVNVNSFPCRVAVVANANTFAFEGVTATGTYTSGGTWYKLNVTRISAVTKAQNGVPRVGNNRYLGTIKITATAGQCEDSNSRRYVWNWANRKTRTMIVTDAGAAYNYGGTTATAVRVAHNDPANRCEFVVGLAEQVVNANTFVNVDCTFVSGTGGPFPVSGFMLDQANTLAYDAPNLEGNITGRLAVGCKYQFSPAAGYHFLYRGEQQTLGTAAATLWLSNATISAAIET